MKIPEDLIQKYNIPVPRYTSYPPANYFSDEFNAANYIEAVENSNNEWPENISIYIHIPYCSKMCHFCGCNTQYTRDQEKLKRYVDAVLKEIDMLVPHLNGSRKVSQIHWGGGTPNTLPVELIQIIMQRIHDKFTFTDNPEIAMECHPAMLDERYVNILVQSGFNRFSLGIQDFKQEVLDNVNRTAPAVPVKEIVNWIRNYDATSVNLDFIYGLPFQNRDTFHETIQQAIDISPDRLVTFSYAHVPWIKKAQKILEVRGLPEADEKLKMFETGYDLLTANGYTPIGLDHFAKDNDELSVALRNRKLHRNFQGYCTRETTGQVYAIGATGISQLESVYAQNEKNPDKYVELINDGKFTVEKGYKLSINEKIIRHIISEVMCNEFVSFDETAVKFNTSVENVYEAVAYDHNQFEKFVNDGLIRFLNSSSMEVTEDGRFFIRN